MTPTGILRNPSGILENPFRIFRNPQKESQRIPGDFSVVDNTELSERERARARAL